MRLRSTRAKARGGISAVVSLGTENARLVANDITALRRSITDPAQGVNAANRLTACARLLTPRVR
jgi:hypothetical protein